MAENKSENYGILFFSQFFRVENEGTMKNCTQSLFLAIKQWDIKFGERNVGMRTLMFY